MVWPVSDPDRQLPRGPGDLPQSGQPPRPRHQTSASAPPPDTQVNHKHSRKQPAEGESQTKTTSWRGITNINNQLKVNHKHKQPACQTKLQNGCWSRIFCEVTHSDILIDISISSTTCHRSIRKEIHWNVYEPLKLSSLQIVMAVQCVHNNIDRPTKHSLLTTKLTNLSSEWKVGEFKDWRKCVESMNFFFFFLSVTLSLFMKILS